MEYELNRTDLELKNVIISIPILTGSPKIDSVDGEYYLNPSHKSLDWIIPVMNSENASGTLEFSIGGDDIEALFPVSIQFAANVSFIGLECVSALLLSDSSETGGDDVDFTKEFKSVTEDYRIV